MRLDELKNDLPETPEFLHSMIQNEVHNQIHNSNVVHFRKNQKPKMSMRKAAAAALVCIIGTSAAAFAGTKMYHLYLEHKGQYSTETGISSEEGARKIDLPAEIHDVAISAGYIPEGMEWIDETTLSYSDAPYYGGISISSVLLDQDAAGKAWLDKNVVESEEMTFGEHDGVYVKLLDLKQDGTFDKRIYLFCPEEYRVFLIYFGDNVSKEDAISFVQNMTITETDEMIETQGAYTWSDFITPEVETVDTKTKDPAESITIRNIGDSMAIETSFEDADGDSDLSEGISACVDNVQILDDLSILDDDRIPEEWKNAVADDGKLKKNHLSYIKSGDGENTLDQVVDEAYVNQKLVCATVTYTNNTDSELKHILYLGCLLNFKQENGVYNIYEPSAEPGDGYDYYIGDGVAHTSEMTYFSVSDDYGNGGNYIASLKPGESIQTVMAWIVNEDYVDDLYLNLNPTGGVFEMTEDMIKTGVVYIGK